MASLVVQTSFLGDVILTTPLVAELARRGAVDVVTTVAGAAVLANHPDVRRVIVYDKRHRDRGPAGFFRVASELRKSQHHNAPDAAAAPGAYEAAYLAQGSIRSGALAVAAGIPNRIGFHTSAGRALYTSTVRYRDDRHHAERLWRLSMSDCADEPQPDQISPRLYPSDADMSAADGILSALSGSKPVVALAPGSAWGTKRWPYFAELAGMLSSTHNIVVVGDASDTELATEILSSLRPGTSVDATGRVGILGSAEIIGRAAALVTNDSAPQHLASAMSTRTVTVFGPTVPEFGFGPLAARSMTVGHPSLDCRPCDRHGPQRCPLGHWRCMRELSAGKVFDLLKQTLS